MSIDRWMDKETVVCIYNGIFMSVQFSNSVVSNSLWPHGLLHARLHCLSPSPGACSYSCPSSRWCHPAISPSVTPFSSCLQSFPESGSLLMSQFFASGGKSIETSASASVLPVNIQDFPFKLTGLISLQSKALSRVCQHHTQFKRINFLAFSLLYGLTLTSIHDYWKTHNFEYMDLCCQSDVSSF